MEPNTAFEAAFYSWKGTSYSETSKYKLVISGKYSRPVLLEAR